MQKSIFALAVAGLIVSGYLSYVYISGDPILCNTTGGCDVVRSSEYASFFGLPTPLYGVLFYVLLFIGSEIWHGERDSVIFKLLKVLTGSGLLVSAMLSYISAAVIDAWCIWCAVSAVIATLAFIVVWFPARKELR